MGCMKVMEETIGVDTKVKVKVRVRVKVMVRSEGVSLEREDP